MATQLAIQNGGFPNPFRSFYRYLTRKNRKGMKKTSVNRARSKSRSKSRSHSRNTRKVINNPLHNQSRTSPAEETKENSPSKRNTRKNIPKLDLPPPPLLEFDSKSKSLKGLPGKLPPKPKLPAPPSFKGTQGFAKLGPKKTRKSRSRSKTPVSPIKTAENIKKKDGIIKGVREFTKRLFSEEDDLDFALDDVRYDRDGFIYMRAPCRNGHALYNVVDKMEVKSIPVQAKANNRINGTYDLDIKDPKLLKDVNHALEKYHKRKIEDKSMALNKVEYMNKCYPDLGIP